MSAANVPNSHGLSLPGRVQINALRRALNAAHPRSGLGEPCVCGAVQGALPRPAACEGLMRLLELGESRRMEDAAAAAVGTRADGGAELVAASLFAAGLGRLAWPSPWTSLGLLWRLAVHGEWVVMPAQARALRTGRAHSISKPVMPGDVVGWHRFPGDRGRGVDRDPSRAEQTGLSQRGRARSVHAAARGHRARSRLISNERKPC
jgi:hypothetical protein